MQHARARRVNRGDAARVTDGKGHVGWGQILSVGKNDLGIAIASIENVPRPLPLDVIVPVADRDRMLAAAEKCVELQVSAWHPAYFARSRSVSSIPLNRARSAGGVSPAARTKGSTNSASRPPSIVLR